MLVRALRQSYGPSFSDYGEFLHVLALASIGVHVCCCLLLLSSFMDMPCLVMTEFSARQ